MREKRRKAEGIGMDICQTNAFVVSDNRDSAVNPVFYFVSLGFKRGKTADRNLYRIRTCKSDQRLDPGKMLPDPQVHLGRAGRYALFCHPLFGLPDYKSWDRHRIYRDPVVLPDLRIGRYGRRHGELRGKCKKSV